MLPGTRVTSAGEIPGIPGRNSSTDLAPFLRYSEILVEKRRFEHTPPLYLISSEFRRDFWRQKTRAPVLSCGVVNVILDLAVFVQLRLVADRQTDRQTDGHTMTAFTELA